MADDTSCMVGRITKSVGRYKKVVMEEATAMREKNEERVIVADVAVAGCRL